MGSKAPTWADQWGSGNYGVEDENEKSVTTYKGSGGDNKMDKVKASASAGFNKAKAAAVVGTMKVKSGTSVGIKWVKTQYQKRQSSSK